MVISEVHEAIAACRSSLQASPIGYLSLTTRRQLWLSFGPIEDDFSVLSTGEITPAHRARAELAIRSCERVLPKFEEESARARARDFVIVSDEDEPRRTLQIARARLRGDQSWEEANERAEDLGNLHQYMSELYPEYAVAAMVLTCALQALSAACLDIEWGETTDDESATDVWGAETYACWAECMASPWDGTRTTSEVISKRRTFWSWYLDQAALIAQHI